MSKFWVYVDNFKVGEIEFDHEPTDLELEKIKYDYAKANELTLFGQNGIRLQKMSLFRVQTEKDFPIFKMRQG